MAATIRHAASRAYVIRNLFQCNSLQKSLLSSPQLGPCLVSPQRSMCILKTYLEETEKKPRSTFVNPLNQPKLKESTIDDIEDMLAKYDLQEDNDQPIEDLPNPYAAPQRKCIICEHNVQVDYKNIRLLNQFVSPHTGQIYGRHITGLCIYMQKRVAKLIKRARYFGLMPYIYKEPKYMQDPKLFDPFKRVS